MILLAILATGGAMVWTGFVVMANSMSDSPSTPFQGKFSMLAAWALALVFWLAWGIG